MARTAAIVLVFLLTPCASAHAAGEAFTVAGGGTSVAARDGRPATTANFAQGASIAALPQGGFLVSDSTRVLRVDPQGTVQAVAGDGQAGYSGDGGPAVRARLGAGAPAALPGGGFLFCDQFAGRVRMVDGAGVISTVAGGGTSTADGVAATRARLDSPYALAATPGGGFVVAVGGDVVRRVSPDGRITTLAGNGSEAFEPAPLHGQPATSVALSVSDVDVAADGSVLLAEGFFDRVDRVAPDGTITELAVVSADTVAATPDGGFLAAGVGRVIHVAPGGAHVTVAGGGRPIATAPLGLEQRLTGEPATGMRIVENGDVAALPDGGVLFATHEQDLSDDGTVVHYVAPATPGVLAAAVLRDRDRVFTPGRAGRVSVALTLPATVTLTVAGHASTASLPAGSSRLALPALSAQEHTVSIVAADTAGRRAFDRARVYPPDWLPEATAQLVAAGIRSRVLHGQGTGVTSCLRVSHARVDCQVVEAPDNEPCRTAAIVFSHARLLWGVHSCRELFGRPRVLHRLRRSDFTCDLGAPDCPPHVFGRLTEAALAPSN